MIQLVRFLLFVLMSWNIKGEDITFEQLTEQPAGYTNEAFAFLLAEANIIAGSMKLNEPRPILSEHVKESHISPPRMADSTGAVGTIWTAQYGYSASQGRKLSYVTRVTKGGASRQDYDNLAANFTRDIQLIEMNLAYSFATNALIALQADLPALTKDCTVEITAWRPAPGKSVPLYWISWKAKGTNVVFVEYFAPEKSLRKLRVENERYLKRPAFSSTWAAGKSSKQK